jgi:capsular exopolysaccharide synthesis family protein
MEKDDRLLTLPTAHDIQPINHDYPSNYSPMNDDEMFDQKRSVREYFNVVYKRLPVIITLTILTTAAVAFYMYKTPSIFMATTKMIIEPRKSSPTSKEININLYNDNNYYATQLLLLQNPKLMTDVMVRLGLHREPNLFGTQGGGFISTVRSMFSGSKDSQNKELSLPVLTETGDKTISAEEIVLTPEEKERAERYAATFAGGLSIVPVERTNLVNINVQSTSPALAARVADTVADIFIEQDIERETRGAKKSLADLSESIEQLKGTIATQSQQLIVEQSKANLPLTGGKGQEFSASRLQGISGQLLTAKDKRRNIEAEYSAAVDANSKNDIWAVVGKDPAIQNMRANLALRKAKLEDRIQKLSAEIQDLTAKKAQLLVKYTEEYKEVKAINEEIGKREAILKQTQSENDGSIAQEETKVKKDVAREVLTGMRAQLDSALKQEAQIQAAFNAELASANRAGVAETRLMTLTREIETNRQLLDTYTQRQKEQELAVASSKPDNLTVTSKAQVPPVPIGPNRVRNIFIAFLLSLAAGIGLAFLLDYLDDSVKTSDDVGRFLGLPTLALIPYQSANEKRKLSLASANGNGNGSVALIALEDNRSAVAEAYRHLRTSLLFSSAGKPPQTILVTSSQPAEGKTTTAINTAITLAQSGAEVVIIDCDLRRPRLHNHFNLENTTGLTNYLSGDRNTENLLKPFPNLPQLKIVTSGPIPPNPAELLSSNEMKNLLQFLKGNFQHVIIDSPPAISFTDAAILSTLVDGVVLVAMAGKSSVHLMRRFKQRLSNIGARIYGVVLNGVKANSTEYAYYGYGYTYNYYTPDNDDDSTPLMEDVVSVHKTEK